MSSTSATTNQSTLKKSLSIGVLTVSDTRTEADDHSGNWLVKTLHTSGHILANKVIVHDDVYQIRSVVSQWIADANVQAVLVTGGTGFTARDTTPEALQPLFDQEIKGYGELFRNLSYAQIGTSTVQSRALAGVANRTVIFVMPGSTGACKLAWNHIIEEQLNSHHQPCNFVNMVTHFDNSA